MSSSKAPEVLHGDVRKTPVRQGTASAHNGLVITTDDGEEFILQRLGANPFADPEGDRLIGQRVAVEGYRLGKVFRYLTASPSGTDASQKKR